MSNTKTQKTPATPAVVRKSRAAKINAQQEKLAAQIAPAPAAKTKRTKVVATPVHSCEKAGIHARGMCKPCYRKARLTNKKNGLRANGDPFVVVVAEPVKRRGRKPAAAPTPIAAKHVEREAVEFPAKRTTKRTTKVA